MRLTPGINRAPWTIFNQIWREETALIRMQRLRVVDIDRVDPSAFLSLARGVDMTPSELNGMSDLQKRAALKAGLLRKRRAGTVWALETALNTLGFDDARLIEWFNQTLIGAAYTFKIELALSQRGPILSDWDRALRIIFRFKNKRSRFSSIRISVKSQSVAPRLASFGSSLQQVRILPFITSEIAMRARPQLAAFARSGACVRIYPQGAA